MHANYLASAKPRKWQNSTWQFMSLDGRWNDVSSQSSGDMGKGRAVHRALRWGDGQQLTVEIKVNLITILPSRRPKKKCRIRFRALSNVLKYSTNFKWEFCLFFSQFFVWFQLQFDLECLNVSMKDFYNFSQKWIFHRGKFGNIGMHIRRSSPERQQCMLKHDDLSFIVALIIVSPLNWVIF